MLSRPGVNSLLVWHSSKGRKFLYARIKHEGLADDHQKGRKRNQEIAVVIWLVFVAVT